MKTFAVIALLLGLAYGNPAKLDDVHAKSAGYVITEPPEIPDLYSPPKTEPPPPPPDTYLPPPVTTTPPPPPPPDAYLPPGPDPTPSPPPTEGPPVPPMMLMPYQFRYDVDDSDSDNHYKHSVVSDGENVEGEYSVKLPDGRRQVVKFSSNPETGYVADVSYV